MNITWSYWQEDERKLLSHEIEILHFGKHHVKSISHEINKPKVINIFKFMERKSVALDNYILMYIFICTCSFVSSILFYIYEFLCLKFALFKHKKIIPETRQEKKERIETKAKHFYSVIILKMPSLSVPINISIT